MAINIIERAVTPYNSSASKVSNKEQYSLYAPAANVNKPGMAGYDPKYFAVREQIVELSTAFLGSILHHRSADEVKPDGIKESNTIYSNFTHEVLDYRKHGGEEVKINVTGNLFVLHDSERVITEILFAVGRVWFRKLYVEGLSVTRVSQFEPVYDKHVTNGELAADAVRTENIHDTSVTRQKIAARAVDTTKLEDSSVTTVKIVTKAVTTDKIADEAVTTDKIADYAVATRKIENQAVTREKVRDEAIDESKLSVGVQDRLNVLEENSREAFERIAANHVNITGITAQVAGIGRSYAVPTFLDFIGFIKGEKSIVFSEDRNGDGIAETITIRVGDLITGDNLLIIEENVPDFWFEKDSSGANVEEYTYEGTTYSLRALKDGVTYGSMHILEGDYTLIVDKAMAAGQSAADAKVSEEKAEQFASMTREYRDETEAIANSIYVHQVAPPISLLSMAILLTAPTLAQLP